MIFAARWRAKGAFSSERVVKLSLYPSGHFRGQVQTLSSWFAVGWSLQSASLRMFSGGSSWFRYSLAPVMRSEENANVNFAKAMTRAMCQVKMRSKLLPFIELPY